MQMRQWLLGAALALLAATATAQDRTRLQVNSVFGDAELGEFKKLFEADNPDIEIVWDRASTGVLTERLLAGQGLRPDAVWGLAVTSMLLLDRKACSTLTRQRISPTSSPTSAIPPTRPPGSA